MWDLSPGASWAFADETRREQSGASGAAHGEAFWEIVYLLLQASVAFGSACFVILPGSSQR